MIIGLYIGLVVLFIVIIIIINIYSELRTIESLEDELNKKEDKIYYYLNSKVDYESLSDKVKDILNGYIQKIGDGYSWGYIEEYHEPIKINSIENLKEQVDAIIDYLKIDFIEEPKKVIDRKVLAKKRSKK